MQINRLFLFALLATMGVLTGCGDNDNALQEYVASVKAKPPGKLEPIPKLVAEDKFVYPKKAERDPFLPIKYSQSAGPKPNDNRVREPLESYALDSLRMVGTLKQGNAVWGLIVAPDGQVFHVKPGDYVGKNDGKIATITDKTVNIQETVLSDEGWAKRDAHIGLSEKE